LVGLALKISNKEGKEEEGKKGPLSQQKSKQKTKTEIKKLED
jgi:hypothetical protein